MFINVKNLTTTKLDSLGNELVSATQTIYLFDGQEANSNTLHPETQKYYKYLYTLQTEESQAKNRPVSIFEALGLGLDSNNLPKKTSNKTKK
jgi:hypothetical protein